jgi:hypothetical protein
MEAAAAGHPVALQQALGSLRNVDEFVRLGLAGEGDLLCVLSWFCCSVFLGSHGVVYKANDKRNNSVRALKRVKLLRNSTAFPAPALKEILCLSSLSHPNIVKMHGLAAGDNFEKIFCVLEFVEHDLAELISVYPDAFKESFVKVLFLLLFLWLIPASS